MLDLITVTTPEHVEWLRVQRSDPRLYKYFRQDSPITKEHQAKWWRDIRKNEIKLFIIENDGKQVGYVGFNPFFQRSGRAEFGMFVIPDEQNKNIGTQALLMLLKKGFTEYSLSTIYSDVLDYHGENRFDFYEKLGFEAFPKEHQSLRYKKQGEWVGSIKFFMTKDQWSRRYGENGDGGLESGGTKTVPKEKAKWQNFGLHPGKAGVKPSSK